MPVSELCQAVNFTNFSQVGDCFVQQALFGDFMLLGIIITVMFVIMLHRYNFPMLMFLPFVNVLTYTLFLFNGDPTFLGLFILSLVASGVALIIGMLNYLNR